jgi:hypothetical protein
MRFQDALRAAVEKRDQASARALDKMLETLDSTWAVFERPSPSSAAAPPAGGDGNQSEVTPLRADARATARRGYPS